MMTPGQEQLERRNFLANARLSAAQLHSCTAEPRSCQSSAYGPQGPNDPFELQISETQNNPDLSQAQKDDMISKLRD